MKTKPTETYYDSIAEEMNSWTNPFDLQMRVAWFEKNLALENLKEKSVLDVGAGLGQFSKIAVGKASQVTTLDIAINLLKKIEVPGPKKVCASAGELPFCDGFFDYVISSECIEHTVDPIKSVGEMLRVLKPGGKLLVTTPNLNWKWSIYLARGLNLRNFSGIENWLSRSALQAYFKKNNVKVIKSEGLHILPFQISAFHPIIRWMNLKGQCLKDLMINQCWIVEKP